jgi:pSer/pThr/pTyr-binding forkhead associated (FHA) protein/ribosomal protein L40E
MIICPNCNHQNPDRSLQCENCYTPLPVTTSCPNCGASVQTDATFCGQCGFNLQAENPDIAASIEETMVASLRDMPLEEASLLAESPEILPPAAISSPIKSPWDDEDDEDNMMTIGQKKPMPNSPEVQSSEVMNAPISPPEAEIPEEFKMGERPVINMPWEIGEPQINIEPNQVSTEPNIELEPEENIAPPEPEITSPEPVPTSSENQKAPPSSFSASSFVTAGATQLQLQRASLLHLQTNTNLEISPNLDVIHLGKPNGQIPPDIDVAGFPDSEVVSRVHADIRVEGDAYYIEDVGSSNGTYVNHVPLLRGNRHRLRAGDRIALGKGDLVTFLFQLN